MPWFTSMLLHRVLEDLALERPIATDTVSQYGRSERCYSKWLRHRATTGDLAHRPVNQWLRSLEGRYRPHTVRGRWLGLSAIWNYAAEMMAGVDPPHPRRIRRCKVPPPQPTIWTGDETVRLLSATEQLAGRQLKCGLNAAAFLRGVVHVLHCSALRRGDLVDLTFSNIAGDGQAEIYLRKTRVLHQFRLDAAAMSAVDGIRRPRRERIFPVREWMLNKWWNRLLDAAGLPRGRREGPQKLRRTSASAIAARDGIEAASAHLGHLTPGLASRYYVPQSVLRRPDPPPPIQPPDRAA